MHAQGGGRAGGCFSAGTEGGDGVGQLQFSNMSARRVAGAQELNDSAPHQVRGSAAKNNLATNGVERGDGHQAYKLCSSQVVSGDGSVLSSRRLFRSATNSRNLLGRRPIDCECQRRSGSDDSVHLFDVRTFTIHICDDILLFHLLRGICFVPALNQASFDLLHFQCRRSSAGHRVQAQSAVGVNPLNDHGERVAGKNLVGRSAHVLWGCIDGWGWDGASNFGLRGYAGRGGKLIHSVRHNIFLLLRLLATTKQHGEVFECKGRCKTNTRCGPSADTPKGLNG
mmetsp:Transcript_3157/g.7597  ORF Transcript_3157/g.7597 Transcript_3157/m.7597 type:complete len:283 (+) Transcript_3157:91-939(+)